MDIPGLRKLLAEQSAQPDEKIDLARAALLLAATEYPGLELDREQGYLDEIASPAARRLGDGQDPLFCVNTLSEYLFDDLGFRGNQAEYYDPRNSYLNEVLSRRTGIPITLSLVYIEVGKRLGIPLVGVGMPGHFLVRHREEKGLFVDPFYGGILLSEEVCAQRLREVTGRAVVWDSGYLAPVSSREFIARMLRNLKAIYLGKQDYARALTMMDWVLLLQPQAVQERRDRGLTYYRLGYYSEALEDLQAYLDRSPSASDLGVVQALVGRIRALLDD